MTKEEAKALVAQKIAGQGTNVDAGSILPAILNFILDQLPGGGGESGLKVIVSTADWTLISGDGVTANTKAEAAQIAGITEEELDLMLDSGAYEGAVLFAYKAGEEACTAIVKRSYDPDDGQSHAYCNMAGLHNLSLEFQPNYGYGIFGAGSEG